MNIFKDTAYDYFDNNINVIPLNGKRPVIKEWSDWCTRKVVDEDTLIKKYGNTNIGLPLGPYNKIIALDIDTDDKKTLDKMPKSPLWKRGKKGETRFFKYNGERSKKRHDLCIELLSLGNQTVIPPSIHPETKTAYFWGGWIDIHEWDQLPTLPQEVVSLFQAQGEGSEVTPSDGSRCNHGSHTKLSSVLVAMVKDGESMNDILDTLLSHDESMNEKISYFLCPSRRWRTKNKIANCLSFISDAISRNGYEERAPFEIVETKDDAKSLIDYKKHKLPKLRGIAQEMFEYIYATSPIPRAQLAFASSISTMSMLLGNRIQYRGTLPNLYSAILAPSGAGKDRPLRFPIDLLSATNNTRYIGEGSPASDTAILMNLGNQKVRIDVIDEASYLFSAMNSSEGYLSNMANIYQKLFTSAGKYFQGKTAYKFLTKDNPEGRLGECDNPYVVMFCALTISDFRNCFRSDLMDKGLGGRFLYFIDDEPKRFEFQEPRHIPENVILYTEQLLSEEPGMIKLSDSIENIKMQGSAEKHYRKCIRELDNRKIKTNNESKIMPIVNRLGQIFTKMAIIDACSIQWNKPLNKISITKDSIDWAMKFVDSYTQNMELFINYNMNDNQNSREMNVLEEEILNSAKDGISLRNLSRKYKVKKLGLLSPRRKQLLCTMLEDGIIGKKDLNFYHSKFIK